MTYSALMTATCLALLMGSACAPRIDHRGHALDQSRLEQIRPGEHSQNQVAALLGSPSSVGTFPQASNTWYYISKDTETLAFFASETVDQSVVAIDFNEEGRVQEIRRYAMEDGKAIKPVSRETPTMGQELGFFEQIFGNIGRFNDQNTGRDAGRR